MPPTDEQYDTDAILRLSSAASEGDLSAYRELFDIFYPRLHRYALVATSGDDALAHEIAQETLLRLHRHLQPFQSDERIWFWLTRAARSALIDASRVRGRQLKLKRAIEEAAAEESGRNGRPSDEVLLEALASLCNELEERERDVIERFYFERQSVQGISEALGITYKAVESKLSRTRAKLRGKLLEKLSRE